MLADVRRELKKHKETKRVDPGEPGDPTACREANSIEVDQAIDVIQRSFKKNYKGCTLLSISYDEDYCAGVCKDWASEYGADEAIVLISSFQTDAKGGDGSLNPDAVYEDWQWVLTRTGGGPWILQTWGY